MAKAKQFTFLVAHRPGTAAHIAKVLAEAKVNIVAINGIAYEKAGRLQLVVDKPEKAKKALNAARLSYSEATVETFELANKPGALAAHLAKLAKKGVNLTALYGTSSKTGKKGTLVFSTETPPTVYG